MRPAVAEAEAVLGTKAETLQALAPLIADAATVLPLMMFTVVRWQRERAAVLDELQGHTWASGPVIVRSSALDEDTPTCAQAGRYTSVPAVVGREPIAAAVDEVVGSYGDRGARVVDPYDQILIQPMLDGVVCSGVAFTGDPATGAPYFVANYHLGRDTAAVTAGTAATDLHTFYAWNESTVPSGDPRLDRLRKLAAELELVTGFRPLDIEFAFDATDTLYLLQVRRLSAPPADPAGVAAHHDALEAVAARLRAGTVHPVLLGDRIVLGVMPDWNPAEIIGIRPRQLALSLYRRLITDSVWAASRARWGYRDVQGCPLMHDFHGLPYIDVRASFNSLLPADLPQDLAARIVTVQLDRLVADPTLHDRVEFDIALSCATLDTGDQSRARLGDALSKKEHATLGSSLRRLTNRMLAPAHRARRDELAWLRTLDVRRDRINQVDLDPVTRARWLLRDCARYGTPAFAGHARLGFVAVELLRSIERAGILTGAEVEAFLAGLDTVTNTMMRERTEVEWHEFLARYGHLRPGTYDICSQRYDQAPELYFTEPPVRQQYSRPEPIELSPAQVRALDDAASAAGFGYSGQEVLTFIAAGIIGREQAKFAFTRQLSDALAALAQAGAERGLSVEDCSYLDIGILDDLYQSTAVTPARLREEVARAREAHALTQRIVLPPLLVEPEQVFAFHQPPSVASFIGHRTVIAPVVVVESSDGGEDSLKGKILLLPSGDPGYDWIYSHPIAGLITAYGGVNSHMAIRAHQTRVPAVLGVGETTYQALRGARIVCIDATNHRIDILA
ncbi:phosphoenolpyruvate synthase [Nocardia puris]|uniref:PEP/pyruvate-binding domain-containing protein n=1 Tax=Nocardia puris TaxID=208602 RepID=UPI001894304F|nr:PEP/pyruvate-binding domain-containing protein [Nocardia puris]MBF6370349.1 phosphoenolpyruvate synthase [Nocardia puris]